MAYDLQDFQVQVRGNLGGGEIWINSWSFTDIGSPGDQQAVVDGLHDFYAALAALWFPAEWTAVGATIRNLATGISAEADWTTITGANEGELLPTQLAVRVSLSNFEGVNGGPFLVGWATQTAGVNGVFADNARDDVVEGVQALDTAAQAEGYVIGIDRPTLQVVTAADKVRVGTRFDVIRKRANALMENYEQATIG